MRQLIGPLLQLGNFRRVLVGDAANVARNVPGSRARRSENSLPTFAACE
jgi:hypothetical protein